MKDILHIIKTTLVLVILCVCLGAALGFTNHITKPQIAEITKQQADERRQEALGDETDFEEIDLSNFNIDGLVDIYKATNDMGYVITSEAKGYGGPVRIMTGFDHSGEIVNVEVMGANETPGLGSRVLTDSFLSQFDGQDGPAKLGGGGKNNIDAVTGATVTSRAVTNAINIARDAFDQIKEGA